MWAGKHCFASLIETNIAVEASPFTTQSILSLPSEEVRLAHSLDNDKSAEERGPRREYRSVPGLAQARRAA